MAPDFQPFSIKTMPAQSDTENSSHLIDGKYGIQDLVDIEQLRILFEQFSVTNGFTVAFLDHPAMNILISTGWKAICTDFHRCNPISESNCLRSNHALLDSLNTPGQVVIEYCENGLVDCAIPIIIEGKHIASLATGQMLLQKADVDRFKRQAKTFGFDEAAYLHALSEVEVTDEQKLISATGFLGAMAQIISQTGYARFKAEHEITERKRVEASRREMEERFQLIFEKSSEATIFAWPDGRIETANAEALRLFGFSKDELCALGRSGVMDISDPRLSAAIEERSRCGAFRGELRCRRKDGSTFPVDVVSTCFHDAKGETRTSSMFRDISERKATEKSLQDSLSKLRLRERALDAISQGVLISGPDRLINYANEAFEKITGYSESDMLGQPCKLLQGAESAVEVLEQMSTALSALQPFHGEILNYRKDGSPFWNDLSITPVFDEAGVLSQFVGVQRDISKRKAAEGALRESQALIRTVFDSLDEQVAVLDVNGGIVAINEAWRRFAIANGATRAVCEGVGMNYLATCEIGVGSADGVESAPAQAGIQEVLSGVREKFELEYPCHSPSERRWFNMRVVPLQGPQGGAVVVHENITERKKMEHERSENAKRLSAVSRHLVAVQEDARRRLAAALHDSTSPNLAAISINSEVAAMALAEGKLEELAARMEDNSALIEETAENIRYICADLRPSALDYAGLASAMEAYASQFSHRTGIVVRLDCIHRGNRLSSALESILFRVFQEALTNIAKHSLARSVTAMLNIDTLPVVLTVTDDGQGFDLESIGTDSGLGIINMREMSEFSGGTFSIDSRPGDGTRIHVEIDPSEIEP